jgi:hypothetical protein
LDSDVTVSNRPWLELLHAEVCWALDALDVDALVIKGPSISEWLYPEGERESTDVDLMLRPSQWDAATSILEGRGFEPTYSGFRETETALHSLDLQRTNAEQGLHGLDLHHYFPGIEADPEEAFNVLWEARLPGEQAGVTVWFPSIDARALIIALHAARDTRSSKTMEDLRRAFAALDAEQIASLRDLAARLDAQAVLRAGIETLPETAGLVGPLGLTDVDVPNYWRLRSQGADPLTAELERIRSLPLGERVVQTGRWVLPSAASLRARDPAIGNSRVRLAGAYVRRWGSGLRRLPVAVSKARAARRTS